MHPYPEQNPPTGPTVTIHTKYPWLAFMLGMFKPTATINGHQVPLRWGENPIPLQPGIYDVQVYVKYLWDVGRAQIQVDNRHGAPVTVYYAAPPIAFMGGAIDFEPVKPPNETLAIVLFLVIPLVIILLCCCVGALGSLGGN